MSVGEDVLAQLCHDLRLLREQAGGPSVRALAAAVGLGKSQVSTILSGRIHRAPGWPVVRALVEACYDHARDQGREQRLSLRSGLDEYWRPRYAMVEHALETAGRERPEPARTGPDAMVPRQLPPIPPYFTGRAAELAALTRVLDRSAGPVLITGMAGVGKTALAVAWAHRAAGRFPDGQLHLDLRGFDPSGSAVTPEQAVREILDGLGVPARLVPPGLAAQIGLYRSLVAGRRILLVLDNARDADQVRGLLPGTAGCRVLVTSRVALVGLVAVDGADPFALDVLPDRDARQLLANRLGRARVDAEPAAADRLVAACGRLPLALAITAARGAARPGFPLSAVADEVDGALAGFEIGDERADVRGVFSWSYRALPAPAAHLFRLLGLHPGPDAGTAAVASLAGLSEASVAPALAELVRTNLATEPAPGRYGLHDLLRAYAMELAGAAGDERAAARRRVLDHYAHTGYAAAMLLSPRRATVPAGPVAPGVTPEPLADREAALRWFAAERTVLVGAAASALRAGYDHQAWLLGWSVADFLELRGHVREWVAVQSDAVTAARRLADPRILARSLLILGNAAWHADQVDAGLGHYHEALQLMEKLGDATGQARALHGLGGLLDGKGRPAEALPYARRSLDLSRAAGDAEGQARAHNAIGWLYGRLGQHRPAIEHCRRALAQFRLIGSRPGQAAAWDSIGSAEHGLGRYDRAAACYREALALLRDEGDRYHEGLTLAQLGDTHLAAGDRAAARTAWRLAIPILEECDHADADRVRHRLRAAGGRDRVAVAPVASG